MISETILHRDLLGLDASPELVRDLWNDPEAIVRGASIGFPIALADLAILEEHLEVQAQAGSIVSAATALAPTTYGGAWIDLSEGRLYVAFTEQDHHRDTEILRQAKDPNIVTIQLVTFARDDLERVATQVYEARNDSLRDLGIKATMLDEAMNRVNIYLTAMDEKAPERIAALMGIDVTALNLTRVEEATLPNGEQSTPLGGHGLNSNTAGDCSAGPYGYQNGPWGPGPWLTTAGHCGNSLYHYNSGDPNVGFVHAPEYLMAAESLSGSADAQRMGLSPPYEYTTMVEGWSAADVRLTSLAWPSNGYDVQGAFVCNSGSHTQGFNNCGTLHSTSLSCNGNTNLRGADYFATPGDSGATIYGFVLYQTNVPLAGLHEGLCQEIYGLKTYTFHESARTALSLSGWYLG